jgi:hypothetical protein
MQTIQFSNNRTMNVMVHPSSVVKLPEVGCFLTNAIKKEAAAYITFLSGILSQHDARNAYALLLSQNKNQHLSKFPDIAFGRGHNYIWFAHCNEKGDLLTKTAIAIIYLKISE